MGPTQQGPLASLHRDPRGQTQANARNPGPPHVFLNLTSWSPHGEEVTQPKL
jgi:hypothetical protein